VDTFLKLTQQCPGGGTGSLEPLTTLLVWTRNRVYRVIIAKGSDVFGPSARTSPSPRPSLSKGKCRGSC
jgi:hypothetical protein